MVDYKGSVMIYAEQNNGKIHPISYELLNKGGEVAKKKGVKLIAALVGPMELDENELIKRGADAVFTVKEDGTYDLPEENIYANAMVHIVKEIQPDILLVGATNFGRSMGPKIASLLGCGLTADCTALDVDEEDGALVQIRPAFSENILAHIKSRKFPQMATIRFKEFDEAPIEENRTGEVIEVSKPSAIPKMVEIIKEIKTEQVDLVNADVVVAGGKGLKAKDDFNMLEELATILGGVVGASRPLVEEGFLGKAHQVGYSGHRVKPKLYVACGVSGAAQHIAGMKESEYTIAINSDPSAPIFGVADLGIVGDLYEVVPELIKELKGGK